MILSNITVPLLGLVDTAVIGHLSHAYFLGGSTVGAMIITFVTWLCSFLRMSTTGLAAQSFGAQNSELSQLILLRGLLVAFALGALMIMLQSPYLDISLALAGGSEQVQFYARQYSEIRIWGLPAALANLVVLGWLLGHQKTRAVLVILLLTNSINLLLDLWFVLGLGWQVQGVAAATLVAEYSGLLIGLAAIKQVKLSWRFSEKIHQLLFQSAELIRYFKLNRDILIRTLCLELCFVFITFQGARLGDDIVAANAILMNFLLLISFGLDGIANASEAMVGEAKGANNNRRLTKLVNVGLMWSFGFACVYSLAFIVFGDWLLSMITDIDSVLTVANQYLPWLMALPVLACWCFLFDGVYVGLMLAKIMRNTMVIATFGGFFPLWFALQSFGNHGLWAAFCGFMLARGVSLAWHYYRYQYR
nr:MATE family efflux transporter [Endozoicomonas sp. G2_1]